ncbi:isopeptide-forming domain-containing fimbrial protein [Lactobacillus sp. CC-MHH1034]|uniref:pilin N-terminal domain-containing protein n=1 Tax=Agrilactobacillus fermenti TaxID=2586909 RepID=UPI001E3B5021|nr:pilin N-terminal domain-containing protein [Agrilactobacillus fermenti]MCD2256503.1 isopeptide-forming domain-containing fimbrial protein [Agrilactobacillus fermenti]
MHNIIMKRVWQILAALMLFVPLLSGALQSTVVQAAEASGETTVTIHKRKLSDQNAAITNDGTEKPNVIGTPLAGAGFTAYDVTNHYTRLMGESGATMASVMKKLAELKPTEYQNNPKYDFGVTNDQGEATKILPNKSSTNGNKNAVYLFIETTVPAGVIASAPFAAGFPFLDPSSTATKYLKDVHLYPKNYFGQSKLEFEKYSYTHATGNEAALQGAKFTIWRENNGVKEYFKDLDGNNEPIYTTDAKEAHELVSGANGKVQLDVPWTMMAGDHYIEETASVDPFHKPLWEKDVVLKVKHDPKDPSKAIFEGYDLNGKPITTDRIYNYDAPEIKKTVNKNDLNYDEVHHYKLTVPIPVDDKSYTKFELTDNYDANLELVTDLAKIPVNVLDAKGSVIRSFEVAGTRLSNQSIKIDLLKDLQANPPQAAGMKYEVALDMKIKAGAKPDTNLENEVILDHDYGKSDDQVEVKTHGYHFQKIDLQTEKGLQGAEFIVSRQMKGQTEYRTYDVDKKQWDWHTDKEAAHRFISNESGLIEVTGLETGQYVLEEVKAPEGYHLPEGEGTKTPFEVTDTSYTDTKDDPKKITNNVTFDVPVTGSLGIIGLILASGLVVTGAVIYFRKIHMA